MTQSRRGFLSGLGAVIAAPAIVRASSLMGMPRAPLAFARIPICFPGEALELDPMGGILGPINRFYLDKFFPGEPVGFGAALRAEGVLAARVLPLRRIIIARPASGRMDGGYDND